MPTDDTSERARTVVEPEVIVRFYQEALESLDLVEEAKADHSAILNRAQAAGIDPKAMKQAHKIVRMGAREGKSYLDNVNFYVNLFSGGMMTQGEMFPRDEVVDENVLGVMRQFNLDREAMARGYKDGKDGGPVDN